MATNKKSKYLALEIIVITVLVVLIAAMLVIYFSFRDSKNAPKIFGYYIYRTHAVNMEPAIPSESAVFASEKEKDNIGENSVVLCSIDDNLTIIRVVEKLEEESGEYYIVRFDTSPSTETYKIPVDSVIAKAVYYDEFTGVVLNFATSEKGIVCLAIIPSILIVIYEVIKIIVITKKSSDDDEEDTLDEKIEKELDNFKKEKAFESPLISYNDYIPPKNKERTYSENDEEKLPVGRFKPAKSDNNENNVSDNESENKNAEKKISEGYIGRFAPDFKNDKKQQSSVAVNNEEMISKVHVHDNISPIIPIFHEDKKILPEEDNALKLERGEKADVNKSVSAFANEAPKEENKASAKKNKPDVNIDDLFRMIDAEQTKLNKNK